MNVAQFLRPGRKTRLLVKPKDIEQFAKLSVRCGNCRHLSDHDYENKVGFCLKHNFRIGTSGQRLCPDHEVGKWSDYKP